MDKQQPNNPLHGKTLETILTYLVEKYGWEGLAKRININCFKSDPSVKSSLKFLRKTEWARKKVEDLYIGACNKPHCQFDNPASFGTGIDEVLV